MEPTIPSVPAPSGAEIAPPQRHALLAGANLADWLVRAVDELAAADDPVSRVAAVGLLLRAWSPTDKSARAREIERFLRGDEGLVGRARAWLASLNPAALEEVLEDAVDEATVLPEAAEAIRAAFLTDDDEAGMIAMGLVLRRDELASLAAALGLVALASKLDEALAHADRAIAAHTTALAACTEFVRAKLGVRLEAIAAADDEAWWARLFV